MEEPNIKSSQYRCPSCGADMRYSGKTKSLYCDHCETTIEVVKDSNVRERDFADMTQHGTWNDSDVSSYHCNNCGSSTIISNKTISTRCPFCNSAVVLDKESMACVRPDTVMPFEVSNDVARQSLIGWRKKRFWAPKDYKTKLDIDSVKGVYIPVWTFDSYTDTSYSGRLGHRRTRTKTVNGKTVTETYIQWFNISGNISKIFDDLMIRGNDHLSENDFVKLSPFPQDKYAVYNDDFLAGFVADNYTLPPQNAFDQAVEVMRARIEKDIVAQYNADVVGEINTDIHFSAKSFKYVMLPVYVTATSYRDKTFNNYVAGIQNGDKLPKVSGRAPVSPAKVTIAVILAILLIVGAIIAMSYAGLLGDMQIVLDNSIAVTDVYQDSALLHLGEHSACCVQGYGATM